MDLLTTSHQQNPLSPEIPAPSGVFNKPIRRHYQSILSRILVIFFLLSFIPIALYALLGAIVYSGSIKAYLPPADAMGTEKVLLVQFFLILLLAAILVIFAASLTTNSLTRPLKRLLKLVRLVGEGKLNYKLKVESSDELGELTDAFNGMVAKLREQQAREKLVSRLKSEFISIAAHQLRTPLSAVKWTFRMMIDGDVGELTTEQKGFLNRGYQINESMILLVNDLLDAARIEEGRFGYTFAEVDFLPYLQHFVERYKTQMTSRQTPIILEEPRFQIPPLTIDESKIDLALQNILDNSMKYTHPESGRVFISLTLLPEYLQVAISDNGVGIPKRQLSRVFSKFFRGDNVVRMETQGSGLGLFITRNIIKNHGGDIWVKSEEDKGTTIFFTLPLSKEQVPLKEATFEEFIGNL